MVSVNTKRRFCLLVSWAYMWVGCATLGGPGAIASGEGVPTISVRMLREQIESDPTIFVLDVRTPEEYDGPLGHIEKARLIPLPELSNRLGELSEVQDQHIYVICRGGIRSANATGILLDAGFQASNVTGGMQAWNAMIEEKTDMKEFEK